MKWYRQYPRNNDIWKDRAYVRDRMSRLFVRNFNLATAVGEYETPWNYWEAGSFTVLDWDIVISREDVEKWEDAVKKNPGDVLVAPCKLYPCSTGLATAVYNCRVFDGKGGAKWINSHDRQRYADFVGFGMIYFPEWVLSYYHENEQYKNVLTDASFSDWHQKAMRDPIRVEWSVRPIHLHSGYDVEEVFRDDPQIAKEPVG